MKGMFVVFEGPDGSGKTSVAREVDQRLLELDLQQADPAADINPVFTGEPTSSGPFGKAVRHRLTGEPADDLTMLFGMLADRAWHLDREVEPWLAKGRLVICDRYSLSTMIYQGLRFDGHWLMSLMEKFRAPDLTVLMDAPLEVCKQRMAAAGRGQDRYEGADLKRIVETYRDYARRIRALQGSDPRVAAQWKMWGGRYDVVDATAPFDQVVDAAYDKVLTAWRRHQQ